MRVPILMYHEISARPHPEYLSFTVTPEQFAQQMGWLAQKGYSAVSLDDVIAHRAGCRALPRRSVVITFDDGCLECVQHAVPILAKHRFTAIFYLVTGCMGKTTEWMRAPIGLELPVIDWRTARQLVASGLSCGSHTITHSRLAEVSPDRCEEELRGSRAVLQDRLCAEIVHVSYPHGSYNDQVRQLAYAAGYQTACTVAPGLTSAQHDPLALPRLKIAGDEGFRSFKLRVRTGKRADGLVPKPLYNLASATKRLFDRFNP